MKRILPFLLGLLFLTAWAAPAQLACTTNNGSITITGYTGSDSAVIIPATTNGLPVTSIVSPASETTHSFFAML